MVVISRLQAAPLVYPWAESAPGQYTQDYDTMEQFWMDWIRLERDKPRTTFLVYGSIKLRSRLPPAELLARIRKAWIALRYFHPAIALDLDPRNKRYDIATPDVLEAWLARSFHVRDKDGDSVHETYRHASYALAPVLHFFPSKGGTSDGGSSGELMYYCHHFFTDGRGTLYVWDALLKLVADPVDVQFGDEWKNLPPAKDDLLGMPQRFPSTLGFVAGAEELRTFFVPEVAQLAQVAQPKTSAIGTNGRLRVSLDARQTAAVVAASKARGISVTAAVKGAVTLVTKRAHESHRKAQGLEGDGSNAYIVDTSPFDCRPWYERPSTSPHFKGQGHRALGVCQVTLIPYACRVGGGDRDYTALANDAHNYYTTMRRRFMGDPDGIAGCMAGVHTMLVPWTTERAPSSPFYSSLGIVNNFMSTRYGQGNDGDGSSPAADIKVDDVWAATSSMMSLVNAWFVSTLDGILRLDATFNEEYVKGDVLKGLVEESIQTLLHELGIEEKAA